MATIGTFKKTASNEYTGDIVTLIGRDRGAEMPADRTARLAGTTVYELLTRLNPLLRKIPVG